MLRVITVVKVRCGKAIHYQGVVVMKFLLSKQALWLFSLLLTIMIGLVLDISAISAEEYAEFDHSTSAAKKANILRSLHTVYVPIIVVGHLIALIIIFTRKYKEFRK